MHEFDIIQNYFTQGWPTHSSLETGVGDDCFVWHHPNTRLVASIDTSIIHRHFPPTATAEQIAQRSFLSALSDLAAMAAKPCFFTLALSMPSKYATDSWLKPFSNTLKKLAHHYHIALAGGDTTQGEELSISIQVHGTCDYPVHRHTAQVNDHLWVSGQLGKAASALSYILKQEESLAPQHWLEAYWLPKPPVFFAQSAAHLFHCAIDISDGLSSELAHLAQASQKSLHINLDAIPISTETILSKEQALNAALYGGDDYQLLFSASPEKCSELLKIAAQHNILLSQIGQVTQGNATVQWLNKQRKPVKIPESGFKHFAI